MKKLFFLIICFSFLNSFSQDVNYFFYDIYWKSGTDTICKIIKNNIKDFRLLDSAEGDDYYCVAKPKKVRYIKNIPDSCLILGFPIGNCEHVVSKDGGDMWITGEMPALSIELYFKNPKKKNAEYRAILDILNKKYKISNQFKNKKSDRLSYIEFQLSEEENYPRLRISNLSQDENTIRLVLWGLKYP